MKRYLSAQSPSFLVSVARAERCFAVSSTARRSRWSSATAPMQHAVTLPNPVGDGKLIADTLRSAGFYVIEGIGSRQDDMTQAARPVHRGRLRRRYRGGLLCRPRPAGRRTQLSDPGRRAAGEGRAAADPHHPGRGQCSPRCRPIRPSASSSSMPAATIRWRARWRAALPVSRSSSMGAGLAPVQANGQSTDAGGLLIAYATDPGAVAYDGKDTHSPYTAALARASRDARPRDPERADARARRGLGSHRRRPAPLAQCLAGARGVHRRQPPVASAEPAGSGATGRHGDRAACRRRMSTGPSSRSSGTRPPSATRSPITSFTCRNIPRAISPASRSLNLDQLKEAAACRRSRTVADAHATRRRRWPRHRKSARPSGVYGRRQADTRHAGNGGCSSTSTGEAGSTCNCGSARSASAPAAPTAALGPRSRAAIGAWQRQSGIVETTYLTPQQHMFLVVQTDPMMAQVRAAVRERRRRLLERAKAGPSKRSQDQTRRYRRPAARHQDGSKQPAKKTPADRRKRTTAQEGNADPAGDDVAVQARASTTGRSDDGDQKSWVGAYLIPARLGLVMAAETTVGNR